MGTESEGSKGYTLASGETLDQYGIVRAFGRGGTGEGL